MLNNRTEEELTHIASMALTLYNLSSTSGLKKLDDYLLRRSYITGYQASKDDLTVYAALPTAPSHEYVNVSRCGVSDEEFGVTVEGSLVATPPAADTKATKLCPVRYGIKKLQIMLTIVDDLVSIDDLIEEHLMVEPINEYVQSGDIVAFNKIYENNESDSILNYISSRISPDDDLKLTSPFTIDEFKDALFQMDSNKSPGPDGLNPTFYKKFWNLLGPEIFSTATF
ncbi:Elongation factor 1-delta [Glycine soja]|uniref:Elongation factor 1-delta n=1 Tax=Glycine soja TaxID=3848 RepID=A0A445GUK2_GLYSO|nr:Elongation factor 1-delta [Glycine soja]